MSKLILYTTHCPKCRVLEEKLKAKQIEFESVDDPDALLKKGILSVPMLEVDGTLKSFMEANKYINSL